jgi:hypothetical protein
MRKISGLIIMMIFVFFPISTFAMESANFSISADAIDVTGGTTDSSNFSAISSTGEDFVGLSDSSSFGTTEDFGPDSEPGISLELDSATKNLGMITTGSPITGTTTATVTTDATGGYDLAIYQDKNLTHTDALTEIAGFSCAISSPCAWSGYGLGFTVQSGTDVEAKWYVNPDYFYASIPDSATIFHTKSGFTSGGDVTVMEYKVDVPIAQKSGDYSNTVTYVATTKI